MNIYSISDFHLSINSPKPMDIFGEKWVDYIDSIFDDWKKKVKAKDVVLLCGDFSWAMKLQEALYDFKLFKDMPGTIIMIRGNHDYWWQSITNLRVLVPKNFILLQNDCVKIGDYIFTGTRGWNIPEGKYNTEYDRKIYQRELLRLEMSLISASKIANNNEKIISLIHYPPFSLSKKETEYTKLFEKYNVYKVIFGHLHGKVDDRYLRQNINGIEYYLSSCDCINNKLIQIL